MLRISIFQRCSLLWMTTETRAASNYSEKRFRYEKLHREERRHRSFAKKKMGTENSRKRDPADSLLYEAATGSMDVADRLTESVESSRDPTHLQDQDWKEFKRERALHRNATIKHKFFKDPPEPSLLTYDAKEQIKFLHAQHPDEWTIDKLAESFPASKKKIRKLIKQQHHILTTIEEIMEHDMKVKENWQQLTEGSGPLAFRYLEMVRNRNLHSLVNAAGNLDLPTNPVSPASLCFVETEDPKPKGQFGRMLIPYLEIQKKKEIEGKIKDQEQQKLMYEKFKTLNLQTLQNVLKVLPQISKGDLQKLQEAPRDSDTRQLGAGVEGTEYRKAFWYQDSNITGSEESPAASEAVEHRSMLDEWQSLDDERTVTQPDDNKQLVVDEDVAYDDWLRTRDHHLEQALNRPNAQPDMTTATVEGLSEAAEDADVTSMPNYFKNDLHDADEDYRLMSHRHQTLDLDSVSDSLDPGVIDTGIIRTTKVQKEEKSYQENYDFAERRSNKYADDPVFDSLSKESSEDDSASLADYYLYDEQSGYQQPFGKRDSSYEDIDIPEQLKSSRGDKMIKRGKEYYDEDGEFLFKEPS